MTFIKHKALIVPYICALISFGLVGCATTAESTQNQQTDAATDTVTTSQVVSSKKTDRPVPNPITNEIPPGFYQAIDNGTRTMSGKLGPDYWQQYATYTIDVELDPAAQTVEGEGTVVYQNNSPDTLNVLFMELAQNLHAEGVVRNEAVEVTGGMNLTKVMAEGADLQPAQQAYRLVQGSSPGYYVDGTLMLLRPQNPVLPGESVELNLAWNFKVPQQGASGRMGFSEDNLFFIAYWYPKMQVYDDVIGWFTDPFTGNAEFYHEFGDYEVNITVPEDWVVAATGSLQNEHEILTDAIHKKLNAAYSSDEVVTVLDKSDFGNVTKPDDDGRVTWKFSAEKVRDFAFSVTSESIWDATRTNVGDVDGDGTDDYSKINAFYRASSPLWKNAAEYTAHSVGFLSHYTGMSYPWPHMTSVEGAGIIGGGMEFPMMTLMGGYNGRAPQDLYAVTAHEIAHMWVPMMVSTNERRYSWIDEGTTTFNETQAKKDYYPEMSDQFEMQDFMSYLNIVGSGYEGEIMRWSDYHYNGAAYGIASYPKPASMLITLRGLLGKEVFLKAYRTFLDRWQYKHPYPWDLFNTFEDVSGRDLDWFWRSWYYETWELDQAVAEVTGADQGTTRILIHDFGRIPMPAHVVVTLEGGKTIKKTIGVNTWLNGATAKMLTVDVPVSQIARVEIDPEYMFPDADRSNNVWER